MFHYMDRDCLILKARQRKAELRGGARPRDRDTEHTR